LQELLCRNFIMKIAKGSLGYKIDDEGFLDEDDNTFRNSSLIRYSVKNKIGMVILSNHQNGKLVRNLMNRIYETVK